MCFLRFRRIYFQLRETIAFTEDFQLHLLISLSVHLSVGRCCQGVQAVRGAVLLLHVLLSGCSGLEVLLWWLVGAVWSSHGIPGISSFNSRNHRQSLEGRLQIKFNKGPGNLNCLLSVLSTVPHLLDSPISERMRAAPWFPLLTESSWSNSDTSLGQTWGLGAVSPQAEEPLLILVTPVLQHLVESVVHIIKNKFNNNLRNSWDEKTGTGEDM